MQDVIIWILGIGLFLSIIPFFIAVYHFIGCMAHIKHKKISMFAGALWLFIPGMLKEEGLEHQKKFFVFIGIFLALLISFLLTALWLKYIFMQA